MLGYEPQSQDVNVGPGAPGPAWDLKMFGLDAIKAWLPPRRPCLLSPILSRLRRHHPPREERRPTRNPPFRSHPPPPASSEPTSTPPLRAVPPRIPLPARRKHRLPAIRPTPSPSTAVRTTALPRTSPCRPLSVTIAAARDPCTPATSARPSAIRRSTRVRTPLPARIRRKRLITICRRTSRWAVPCASRTCSSATVLRISSSRIRSRGTATRIRFPPSCPRSIRATAFSRPAVPFAEPDQSAGTGAAQALSAAELRRQFPLQLPDRAPLRQRQRQSAVASRQSIWPVQSGVRDLCLPEPSRRFHELVRLTCQQ